jgi:selenocysteine lyase/cysteine desulfurase
MQALAPALMPYLRRGGSPAGARAEEGQQAVKTHDAAVARLVADGVVRVSLLHYNTEEEVEGLLAALQEVL